MSRGKYMPRGNAPWKIWYRYRVKNTLDPAVNSWTVEGKTFTRSGAGLHIEIYCGAALVENGNGIVES